jgi:hypothetical protein
MTLLTVAGSGSGAWAAGMPIGAGFWYSWYRAVAIAVARPARRGPGDAGRRGVRPASVARDPDICRFEDMTGTQHEDQPNRINPIAIIAGALASLSAAVVASYFGVAGTLIGAAVVSVVSSLAAALYAGLLGRGQGLVHRTATTVLRASDRTGKYSAANRPAAGPPGGAVGASAPGSGEGPEESRSPAAGSAEGPAGRPTVAPGSAETSAGSRAPTATSGAASSSGGSPRAGGGIGWPWRRSVVVIGAAVLIFAIAIGAVSGIEAAIKEPISTALGARDKGQARTSVGVAMDRAGGSSTTRRSTPSSSTQTPPTSGQQGQAPSTTGTGPSTTEPGPPSTEGGQPPSTTLPPGTSQPSSPSSSSGATSSR